LLKRIYSLPFIIAINRKVGLKKAPSCLNFTASIIKKLLVHVIFKQLACPYREGTFGRVRSKLFTQDDNFLPS